MENNFLSSPTKNIDWFLEKKGSQIVIAFLLIIVIVLSIIVQRLESRESERVEELKSELALLENIQSNNIKLQSEIVEARMNTIMVSATSDYNPIPMWLTDKSGTIIWINRAYIKKYLDPKGIRVAEVLGTRGEYIFGEAVVSKFLKNNEIVLQKERPLTFKELEITTRFPVKVGQFIFAIGGVEYETFYEMEE